MSESTDSMQTPAVAEEKKEDQLDTSPAAKQDSTEDKKSIEGDIKLEEDSIANSSKKRGREESTEGNNGDSKDEEVSIKRAKEVQEDNDQKEDKQQEQEVELKKAEKVVELKPQSQDKTAQESTDKEGTTTAAISTASPAEKPKFVFGSNHKFSFGGKSSTFGMFGGFNGKSVFDKSSEDTETKPTSGSVTSENKVESNSTPLNGDKDSKESKDEEIKEPISKPKIVFGQNSKFGNAFQSSISEQSIFSRAKSEDLKDKESSVENDKENENENEKDNSEVYKAVHLEKQEIKSGEESEECLFSVKAKLYNLDLTHVSEGWKERGVGILKVNKQTSERESGYKARMVMRQEGNFKLILNIPIVKDFKIYKGMVSSLHSDKFIRFQVIEDGKPTQYALKIGMIENCSKLYDTIEKVIPS